ncbi:MAG: hypoxanthine-guanine phosphoribosyltransferase [Hahellaceae bacterium]|nr:hypoxanthine-guanine phosphoribosyltransferase [Hahellaceae bacterium]
MTPETLNRILQDADCLHSAADVEAAITRLAREITAQLSATLPLVYTVMNGGQLFAARLLLALNFPLEATYIHATRYRGDIKGGELHWKVPPADDLSGRTLLILDDILDEGATLQAIVNDCRNRGARQIYTSVLVEKRHDRKVDGLEPCHFVGLQVPDRYIFGYGMDYREYWRNAPGIYAVKGL